MCELDVFIYIYILKKVIIYYNVLVRVIFKHNIKFFSSFIFFRTWKIENDIDHPRVGYPPKTRIWIMPKIDRTPTMNENRE